MGRWFVGQMNDDGYPSGVSCESSGDAFQTCADFNRGGKLFCGQDDVGETPYKAYDKTDWEQDIEEADCEED